MPDPVYLIAIQLLIIILVLVGIAFRLDNILDELKKRNERY